MTCGAQAGAKHHQAVFGIHLCIHLSTQQDVDRMPLNSKPPNHLIIVCGHGIWLGGPQKGWDEAEWLIESYKSGETPTFIEHIKAGVKVLSEDDRAVLVFSG